MAIFNKPFVAKNGIEPGSNNAVDVGSSTNQFKDVYANGVTVTGGLSNSTSTIVHANGHIDAPSANIPSIDADVISASNVTVTNFESVTVNITDIDANTVTAASVTANSLNFDSANHSPNVSITVNGDVQGVATAELTNLTDDADITLSLELTDTGVSSGEYGNATSVPIITVDLDGRVTNATETDVSIEHLNTNQLAEGNTNLYYTTARANADIDARVTETFVSALNVDAQTVFGNTASDLLNFNNFTNLPSPNVSITVNGDMTGVATADIANLASDADISLDITLNANQTFDAVTTNTAVLSKHTSPPAYAAGKMFYGGGHECLVFMNNEADIRLQIGQESWIRVYNNTGSTITNGTPCYLTGHLEDTHNIPTCAPGDASQPDKYNISGLATHDIEDGTYGFLTEFGMVNDVDTSAFTEDQRIFLGYASPGTLVQPSPSYPNYPMCVGTVIHSSNTNGKILVELQNHSVNSFRVLNDARVDGDFTVAGDLNVLGTETVVSLTNIAVDDTFFYLGSGDSISNTVYVGNTGLNDASYVGTYEGTATKTFSVRIDGTSPDTFEWSIDNFSTTKGTGIAITGDDQLLEDGISIHFAATTGHTIGDQWDGDVAPRNVDFGLIANYSNSTLYSHAGWFRDATDDRFKIFKRYDPEVEGTVDTSNSSFQYADLQVNSIFGHTFSGNVTGTVTGTVSDISNHDTDNLSEGNTNLYYTTARANTDIDARVTKSFVDTLGADAQTVNGNTASDLLNFNNFTNLPSPNVNITVNGDIQGVATADIANLASDAEISLSLELTDTGVTANTYGDAANIPVLTIDVDGRVTQANTVAVAGVSNVTYESTNAEINIQTADGGTFTATIDLDAFDTNDLAEGNTNLYYTTARANTDIDARVTKSFIDALGADAQTVNGNTASDLLNYNNFTNTPANTSTSSASYTGSNNTLTFTRADSSTFNVTGPFLPLTIALNNAGNTTQFATAGNTDDIAIGTNASATATGTNKIAIGSLSNANGFAHIAIGLEAAAYGSGSSMAIGRKSAASGAGGTSGTGGAVALGWLANAYTYATVALGAKATAAEANSTAIGSSAKTGEDSFGAVAIGLLAEVANTSNNAVAIGTGVVADVANTIFLGDSNYNVKIQGGLNANGSLGTAGQVLTSNGSIAYWSDLPANTSTSNAVIANSTITFTRADSSTFDIDLSQFDNPANTSTSNVEFTSSNNTLTFTRADSSTYDVTGPFLPDTLVLENTTDGASITDSANSIAIGANATVSGNTSNGSIVVGADASSVSANGVVLGTGATVTGSGGGAGGWGHIAIGHSASANGLGGSIAIGRQSQAEGYYSTAVGDNSLSANLSVAVGHGASSNQYGVAVGDSANANDFSVAIGWASKGFGKTCTAVGGQAYATGNSVSIGYYANCTQSNCVTIGHRSLSIKEAAVAIGANVYNDGTDSVTIGYRANNYHDYGVTIGRLATTQGAANWKGVAVGMSAAVYANSGIAIGSEANSSAEFAVAIGQGVTADVANTIFLGDTNYSVKIQGDTTVADLVVQGDLTVQGNTTYLNTTNLQVEDNIIILAANQASGLLNAGIEVDRGSDANVSILWNESSDQWTLTNDGNTYDTIVVSGDLPANTSTSSLAWDDANNTLTLTRADSSTTEVEISFAEYLVANDLPANTSTSNVEFTSSNNTLTFTRADSSTYDVTGPFLPPTIALQNTTATATATGSNSIAIGTSAVANATRSVSIGYAANIPGSVTANDCVSIGSYSYTKSTNSVAIGTSASTNSYLTVVIGANASVDGVTSHWSTAIGSYARNSGARSTVLGSNTFTNGSNNVVIGHVATTGSFANGIVLVGVNTYSNAVNSIVIGQDAEARGSNNSVVIGKSAFANASTSGIAIGPYANTTGATGTAVGYSAWAGEQRSTAIGQQAEAWGNNSASFGSFANATGDFAVALGANTLASNTGAVAIGHNVTADEANTIFLGDTNFDVKIQGGLNANGSLGTDGQVLTSNGSVIYWDDAAAGGGSNRTEYVYTATQGQTTFSANYTIGVVDVFLNGYKLNKNTDFVANTGTDIVISNSGNGLNAGDIVNILAYPTFDVANTYSTAEIDDLLGDIANTLSTILGA